jgi:hypothetical protein
MFAPQGGDPAALEAALDPLTSSAASAGITRRRFSRQGCLLVVFPEGYPNIDPHYTPKRTRRHASFKSGFATIAAVAEETP